MQEKEIGTDVVHPFVFNIIEVYTGLPGLGAGHAASATTEITPDH